MPRDGSNVYHYPTGIEGEPNQTIESPSYNSFLSDVEQDLNLARPILAGGTGATSAASALTNLGAEKSKQGPVTNYDTFPWVNGSFSSDAGATGAPTADGAFVGNYYEHINPQYAVIEARQITGPGAGAYYARQKSAGVWGSWVNNDAAMDAKKVNRAGDTMTGVLTLAYPNPTFVLNKPTGANGNQISGLVNNTQRWLLRPGDDTVESGSNAGSNFDLHRYADNGAYIGQALYINRATGQMTVNGRLDIGDTLTSTGDLWIRQGLTAGGTMYFGSSGARYLQYDGTNYAFGGANVSAPNFLGNTFGAVTAQAPYGAAGITIKDTGSGLTKPLRVNTSAGLEIINHAFNAVVATITDIGDIMAQNSVYAGRVNATAGTYFFGNNGVKYLSCDGTNYHFGGGGTVNVASFAASGNIATASGAVSAAYVTSTGNVNADGQLTCGFGGVAVNSYTGSGNPWQTNAISVNPNWNNIGISGLHYSGIWAGIRMNGGGISFDFRMNDSSAHKTSGTATWVVDSDVRVKTVKGEYTSGLNEIASLRPIYFNYKRNHSSGPPEKLTKEEQANVDAFRQIQYVGLVAQEAEIKMPELFARESAYIDGAKVEDMRTAEYTPLIFALVNAVKELKKRVEELEAR